MKIFRRWAGPRPACAAPGRANRNVGPKMAGIPEGQRLPSADHEPTGPGHNDEKLAVTLDDCHRLRTEPDAARGLKLDQEQAKVVLAAAHAELVGDARADSGPTEDQIIGGNEANDYWNQAGDYELDREAGE
jgi:hypothetical protein